MTEFFLVFPPGDSKKLCEESDSTLADGKIIFNYTLGTLEKELTEDIKF